MVSGFDTSHRQTVLPLSLLLVKLLGRCSLHFLWPRRYHTYRCTNSLSLTRLSSSARSAHVDFILLSSARSACGAFRCDAIAWWRQIPAWPPSRSSTPMMFKKCESEREQP